MLLYFFVINDNTKLHILLFLGGNIVKFITTMTKNAKKSLHVIRKYYNDAYDIKLKSDFVKLLCSDYYRLEKAALNTIKNLHLDSEIDSELYDIMQNNILHSEFILSYDSLSSILDYVCSEIKLHCSVFFNIVNIINVIILNDIYVNIYSDTFDFIRLQHCINILNNCDEIDLEKLAESCLPLEILLCKDPANIYRKQTNRTRSHYRYMVEAIAKKTNSDEISVANRLLDTAQIENKHIGFTVYAEYNMIFTKKTRQVLFTIIPPIIAVIITVFLSVLFNNYYLIILLLLPITMIIRPISDFFILRGINNEILPKLKIDMSIGIQNKTGVVVSMLMPSCNEMISFKNKMVKLILQNVDENIIFIILIDLIPSDIQFTENDKMLINSMNSIVDELNLQYNNRVILLVRDKEYSPTQKKFIGKNRKYGAIQHLIKHICGKYVKYNHTCGDLRLLSDIKYILTLDYDTELLINSVRDFIGVASHPLNKPIIDSDKNSVISGYGIINPSITLDLKSSLYNRFTQVVGGIGGISSYNSGCSDINQKLYGKSFFTGKGLIDVNIYNIVMSDKLIDETVLSHDIIEGIFLRTGFAGEIEVLDSFPTNTIGFFKRMHRWIRGDFQNVFFIFSKKYKINFNSKLKLISNIVNEINPIFSLLCLLNSNVLIRLIGLISICAPYVFQIILTAISGAITHFTTQTFSGSFSHIVLTFLRGVFELFLLPQYAYITINGGIKGVYRRYISKKNMLEWTTASQIQFQKNSTINSMIFHLPNLAVAVFSIVTGRILLGAIFLCGYIFSITSQHEKTKNDSPIKCEHKTKLLDDMAKMLRYYKDNISEETNFLPPDNIQFSPVFRIANRTSPTNIGMMLLSFLSARDFKFITTEKLHYYVNNVLNTIEKMEKYKGNLYNWYNINTLEVLPNKFVSTVDSGNFVCCLVALKEGLLELASDFTPLLQEIERINNIINITNLTVFYNEKKDLFSIGYDSESGKLSNSHYDMLMSEARMTSYYAVAKGLVPKKHWYALSRTLSRQDVYTGAISWTGTMFEYFMPELLLHSCKGSLSYESLHYCIFCQKNRVRRLDIPFGISESAIYEFDSYLNYQYNPNGVQRLALKSQQNNDLVVSPYSTYLTLCHDFKDSYVNLLKFAKVHCEGKYGYYECIDYTESRVGKNNMQIVRSYMAHHIGMSVVAVSNALENNIMQKRFLNDNEMNRACELLQDKMQIGEVVLFEQMKREEAKNFMVDTEIEEFFGELHPSNPKVKLLSNNDISLVASDLGASCILKHNTNITRQTEDILRNPIGSFCFIKLGNQVISLTYAPSYSDDVIYETSMSNSKINYYAKGNGIKSKIVVSLCQTISCEIRNIMIDNISPERIETSMIVYIEPALANHIDFESHKSFSKLFLNVTYDQQSNTVVASRKKRGSSDVYFMAVGFDEDINFDLQANRESLFVRNNIEKIKLSSFEEDFLTSQNNTGVPDPVIAIKVPVNLNKGEKISVSLLTSVGTSKQEAIDNIILVRNAKESLVLSTEPLKKNSLEQRITQVILPSILYQKFDSTKNIIAKNSNILPASSLWRLGIGVNYPIILVEVFSENDMDRVKGYVDSFRYIRLCGINCSIVFLCENSLTVNNATNIITDRRLESEIRHNFFVVDKNELHDNEITLLNAVACHIATRSHVRIETPLLKYRPIEIKSVQSNYDYSDVTLWVEGGLFKQESFFITKIPKLPWCHVLANATFGTLLSDKSLGFTWAINSRQMKLTPWSNDTMMDNNGELLLARVRNNIYNLIDGSTPEYNPRYAKYHSVFGNYTCGVTVSVPSKGMIKYVDVELKNNFNSTSTIEVSYYLSSILGVDKVNSRLLKIQKLDNVMVIHNPDALHGNCYMGVSPSTTDYDYTCDRLDFFSGNWNKNSINRTNNSCVAITIKCDVEPNETMSLKFMVAFSSTVDGLLKLLKLNPNEQLAMPRQICVETNDKSIDMMVNTWLPHQILAGRIYARTGFYQCGGAYGFRDQLQDVMAAAIFNPNVAKIHIIRCCASQFEEGDVLHWWHNLPLSGVEGGKRGVRTRYSDDLVWLAYVVNEYVNVTGDTEILSVMVKYLTAEKLYDDEKDRYLEAKYTVYKESVYNHCKRALKKSLNLGEHGLVKIGGGDWNDGYSSVGKNGKGESVWLSQFIALTLKNFSTIALIQKDSEMELFCLDNSKLLLQKVDEYCYDRDHYIRAFYDNGEKMGSNSSDECRIDSLTQSFAALSGMSNGKRVLTSLQTAYDVLVDKKYGIVKLFYPPFDKSFQEPGYVKAYPRGVRENGGQYTHAAIWFAMAMKKVGKYDEFFYISHILNPINKYLDNKTASVYKTEPYYISADIYANEFAYGRGGWSIYTGSAAWYYKLLTESVLGITIKNDVISFNPCLPKNIVSYNASIFSDEQTTSYVHHFNDD